MINFFEQKTFALNINNVGNISQPINEGFDYIKKIKSIIEKDSYTIFKYNTSKFQIEFSKKVNSTNKDIGSLNNINADSNVMYVLASFIVPKFKISYYRRSSFIKRRSWPSIRMYRGTYYIKM